MGVQKKTAAKIAAVSFIIKARSFLLV